MGGNHESAVTLVRLYYEMTESVGGDALCAVEQEEAAAPHLQSAAFRRFGDDRDASIFIKVPRNRVEKRGLSGAMRADDLACIPSRFQPAKQLPKAIIRRK